MDDPWASDRTRVAVCVSVTPLHGVDFGTLEAAVLGVQWGERKLKWHDTRWAPCSESDGGWAVEATCSLLASGGDESGVCNRIEVIIDYILLPGRHGVPFAAQLAAVTAVGAVVLCLKPPESHPTWYLEDASAELPRERVCGWGGGCGECVRVHRPTMCSTGTLHNQYALKY